MRDIANICARWILYQVWFFEDTSKHEFLVCYQCDMNNEKQELVLDFFLYCIDRDIVAWTVWQDTLYLDNYKLM